MLICNIVLLTKNAINHLSRVDLSGGNSLHAAYPAVKQR